MRELESIISAFDRAISDGLACVLATVVHVEGSSYRKAGARMLVDENGVMTGAISGGCLEGDALRKALHALHQGKNKLVTYDTSDEDDAVIGAQLGCNGVIQVLFEPIDTDDATNPIALLKKIVASDQQMIILTLFNLDKTRLQKGTIQIIDEQLNVFGESLDPIFASQVSLDAQQVFAQQAAHFGEYSKGEVSIFAFLELYKPPLTLVLVGGGNDSQLLAQMADLLGWKVIVADGRPTHANAERFTSSCQVVVTRPEHILKSVPIDERTVFVLISHNYHYDLSVLKLLLPHAQIPYIGILGPKKKYERMLDDLRGDGIDLSAAQAKKIFAPIGLHIGAETPAEIALSILSEIQMVLTNTNGFPLREKKGAIHEKKHHSFKVMTL